jgi:hypothetical protein
LIENAPLVLEHRAGEYIHFITESGDFEWIAVCDGKEWYQGELDKLPYLPDRIERYANGADGFRVVSHGFLEGTVTTVQPPEPTEVGAMVRVGGVEYLRSPGASVSGRTWVSPNGVWTHWDAITSRGPVEVIAR